MKRAEEKRQPQSIRRHYLVIVLAFSVATALIIAGFEVFLVLDSYKTVRNTLEEHVHTGVVENHVAILQAQGDISQRDAVLDFMRVMHEAELGNTGVHAEFCYIENGKQTALSACGDFPGSMPDYEAAMESPGRRAYWVGRHNNRPVYCMSYRLDTQEDAAIRLFIPLREVNNRLATIGVALMLLWLVFCTLLLLFTRLSLQWVQEPITRVSAVTKKIAEGDYEERIPLPDSRNEIYQISKDINHMAEKVAFAERTKMDFISTISHELRTPLTAIKGWGETLLQTKDLDSDLTHRGLGVIIEESRRLDRLVEDLLDFAHIQNNRLVLRHENIDILAELDDTVFLFRERAARKGVEFTCVTPEIPAPMAGDPARIRQVFINLLDNAFKHTPQGGSVHIAAHLGQDQHELHVTIQDTGCGVDEKELPHLTEKFYKSSTDTKGSGIGLAVVSEILRAHGCALRLESAAGQGFKVHITFPLMKK